MKKLALVLLPLAWSVNCFAATYDCLTAGEPTVHLKFTAGVFTQKVKTAKFSAQSDDETKFEDTNCQEAKYGTLCEPVNPNSVVYQFSLNTPFGNFVQLKNSLEVKSLNCKMRF